jgi:hypothetical protein
MGQLLYGSEVSVPIDDRALLHLQLVMFAKLRRQESFAFSWRDDISAGVGQGAIWVSGHIPLYFRYAGTYDSTVNRAWIDMLLESANTPQGLKLMPEPVA